MSSIVDRRPDRTARVSSRRVDSQTELLFWIAFILFAAAMIGAAAVGSPYAYQLPSETFLVGP